MILIIGVIYYFTPDIVENKENMYYLIDIVFYNNIINNNNSYNLNYIFYNKDNYLKIKIIKDISNLLGYLQNGNNNFLNINYINENKMELLYNTFKNYGNNKSLTKKCLDLCNSKIKALELLENTEISQSIKYILSLSYKNKKH